MPPRALPLLVAAALACAHAGSAPTAGAPPAASVPQAASTPARIERPWSDEILYFVLVDRFADGDPANDVAVDRTARGAFHGGDLAGLTARLDEIASLGVTAIWVNPLVDNIDGFVTGAGFPDWAYHGYWADDFTKLDARFGTERELRAFVDACHARGIRVLLDVVYNHPGYDSRYVRDPRFRGWTRNNTEGTCGDDDLTSCLAGLPDFRTELPQVATYLLDAQIGWAIRSGVDGFRLDTLKHVDHPFWQRHRARTRAEVSPGFFLLGELWAGGPESLDPWFAADEMDAGFDFGFQGSVLGWLMGRGRTVAFDRYLASRHRVRPGYHLAHFLSSHDVPGALHVLGGDREAFRLAAVLQFTAVGIPVVYYGEEVARAIGEWPENRSDMPWGDRGILPGAGQPRDEGMRAHYRRLAAVRGAHPALSRGVHQTLATDGDLLVFLRRDAPSGDAVAVAVNRGAAAGRARFALPPEWAGRALADVLAGVDVPVSGEAVEVEVPARGARILAPR
ncbi:MAG TPA: alpha-amylase family glycosyl hydrolase [Anaeromyxobacteraceae bacterium]|nr:alpha-amylase family glycosyl hydrolase [Anaeromyxobacteraceae bacterium]